MKTMTNRKTCRLPRAMARRGLVQKVHADEIRVALAKTRIGTCSKTGSGKRSRIVIRREVAETDHPSAAATEIVVAAVEIVADVVAGIVVDAEDAAAVEIAVDGKSGLARRGRHVQKSVHAVTNLLVLLRQHLRLLEVNPVIRPLGHDVTTAHAKIVARERNADLIVISAVTNRDQPSRVSRQLHPKVPKISVAASLKNQRRPHRNQPHRSRPLRPLVRRARNQSHKVRKPLMRCCGI